MKKGFVGYAILIVCVLVAVLALVGYTSQLTQESKAREASIKQGQYQYVPTQTGAVQQPFQIETPTCLYHYSGVKPYYNLFFEDLVGTAVNPTVYFYNTNPKELSNGAYWQDERAWSDSSGTYYTSGTASSGKLQKQFVPGTQLWFHADLASYQDAFGSFTAIECGDITPTGAQDTNTGISIGTFTMGQYDTTAWTSSAIDMTVSANQTNYNYYKDVTYGVAKNKVVQLDQIKMNITKGTPTSVGCGIHKVRIILPGNKEILVYDYDAGIDKTNYQSGGTPINDAYDSSLYPGDKALLRSFVWTQDQLAQIRVDYYMDTTSDTAGCGANTGDGYCMNGNVTGNFYLYDVEGNALIDGQQITC